jgi:hypothetical protein
MDRLDSAGRQLTTPALRVPCFNEEAAVATVVADVRKALSTAEILR